MPPADLDHALAKHRAGRVREAEADYLRLLEGELNHPQLWHLLGVAALQTGRAELAVERITRAATLKPDFPEALSNLGNALKALGRDAEALERWAEALALKPDFPEALHNSGLVLHQMGRLEEAVSAYERAVSLRPDYADALCNLGAALREMERLPEAETVLRRAVGLRPGHADSLSNLGMVLLKRDRIGEAIAALRAAMAADPRHVRAWANLGLALEEAGEIEEAAKAHGRAMELDPAFDEPLPNLVHLRRKLCLWDRFAEDDHRLLEQVRAGKFRIPPFIVLHSAEAGPAEHRMAARRWAAGIKPAGGAVLAPRPVSGSGPLHVGYLSADLRGHPVGYLLPDLLRRHDRSTLRISAYSYGEDDSSPTRRKLEAAVESFIDIRDMEDQEAARRIRADGIDILVDLTGYTTGARTAILAARPAPIQVNWLGYAGTMGADFMDWLIADPVIAPMAEAEFYDERLIHLPGSYLPFDPEREVGVVPSRAQCGLPEDGVVFCAFHNTFKITPPVFDVWMRLLGQVPGSVLWLLAANPTAEAALRSEAAKRGVDAARLVFAPRVPIADYLARHALADLYLDALPYNGHGSAADALWMGLPVLTCMGNGFPGRVAARLLDQVGMSELATRSLAEYEALGLDLARDPARLRALRARLEQGRSSAPLFDMAAFARDLDGIYLRLAACAEPSPGP